MPTPLHTSVRHSLVVTIAVVGLLLAAPGIAAATTWGAGRQIPSPANASGGFYSMNSGACPASGSCVAVGEYENSSSQVQGLIASQSSGTWQQAIAATPPANAKTGSRSGLESVACSEAESCTAVGGYEDTSGKWQTMAVTETSGTWARATEISPPANASATEPYPSLDAVSCSPSGPCVAVGFYNDSSGQREAMVASESGGTWTQATATTLPANANSSEPFAALTSVSCPASGSCVAVGFYEDSSGHRQAMIATQTSGTWGQASTITPPADASTTAPFSSLQSVSCPTTGSCVAEGQYNDTAGDWEAMSVTESSGSWAQASEVPTFPGLIKESGGGLYLRSIACLSLGSCVAVGEYAYEETPGSRVSQTMMFTDTAGTWSQPIGITPPANTSKYMTAATRLQAVACPPSGACVAVGTFDDEKTASVEPMAVVEGETGGGSPPPVGTTTALEVSTTTPAVGEAITYTATVRPESGSTEPSGSVSFLDGGTPIPGCASQPLTARASSSVATCTITYTEAATHSISAVYEGEAGTFTGSASGTQTVTVHTASSTGGGGSSTSGGSTSGSSGGSSSPSTSSSTPSSTSTPPATAAATATVALASSAITVQSSGKAGVKLACTGTATCSGKLTLTVKTKAKKGKKAKAETIGTASYSIAPGKSATITVSLTATGRALIKAGHGKLSATLTILKTSPAPTQTKAATVHLEQQTPKGKKAKK